MRDARKARRVQTAGAMAVLGDLATGESWGASAAGHDAFVNAALEATSRGVDADADRTAIETLATAARQTGSDRRSSIPRASGSWGPLGSPSTNRRPSTPYRFRRGARHTRRWCSSSAAFEALSCVQESSMAARGALSRICSARA